MSEQKTITIPLEDYIRLRVSAERDERFFEWDISCNWSDYDNALYSTRHDNGEEEITIDEWEANLRKELTEKAEQ